jgi:hypothetical protein
VSLYVLIDSLLFVKRLDGVLAHRLGILMILYCVL